MPVSTPTYERRFGVMSEVLLFKTNDERLMDAAAASLGRFRVPDTDRPPLTLCLLTTTTGPQTAPPAELDNLLTYGVSGARWLVGGSGATAAVDLEREYALGFVSPSALERPALVRYGYIESTVLAMLEYCRGYFSIHAAGVARNGVGVAVHGAAGSGKSTLAIACARQGLQVFAEDGVFVHMSDTGLEFTGLPWTQRLLADSVGFFPELADLAPTRQPNGELKLEVDLDVFYPGRALTQARPAAIVVLERVNRPGMELELLGRARDVDAVEILWSFADGWGDAHEHAVEALGDLDVYRLRTGGPPDASAAALDELLAGVAPKQSEP